MKCLTKECRNKPTKRGVCSKCYSKMLRDVTNGKSTWSLLEACGAIRPRIFLDGDSKV